MEKFFLNKKFLIFLAILALVATIVSILISLFKQPPLPQIISSSPSQNALKADVFAPLTIQFDQDVLISDLTIASNPTESWNPKQLSPTSLELDHEFALHPSTKYELTLVWKSKSLAPLTFTTQASQGDPRLVQTLTAELNRDYPLAKQTPYDTTTYYAVYSAPMTLEITIKNPAITPEKAFSDIRAWVTSEGGDATAHKYVISDKPLPSPAVVPKIGAPSSTASPSPTPFDWSTLKDDGT